MTAEASTAPQSRARMWTRYRFGGFEVRVIQKWADPYGRRMVRIADTADADRAMGLPEDEFMAGATLSATQDDGPLD